MGGMAIALIVAVYLAVAVGLIFKAKNWKARLAIALIALLLPTADGYIGRRYVEHLCAKDGGLKVFRVVENVEGVLGFSTLRATFERMKYQFLEMDRPTVDQNKKYRRIERLPSGEIVEGFASKPLAKYKLERIFGGGEMLTIGYSMIDDRVVVIETGEVLVRYRQYGGGAGWAERFLGQFTDSGHAGGALCPAFEDRVPGEELVRAVLKP